MRYPLANPGIFNTIQGEGYYLGVPMTFIRLGGCSVNCEGCDTNYAVANRMSIHEILSSVSPLVNSLDDKWVFITGGEPADHDLKPLLIELKKLARVSLVTSGRKEIRGREYLDFLSVSPHGTPDLLMVQSGNQVNIVPRLGGTNLIDWIDYDFSGFDFKWVTPEISDQSSINDCLKWVACTKGWRVGVQAHKTWGIP
jgi:organic radical activating enzyme